MILVRKNKLIICIVYGNSLSFTVCRPLQQSGSALTRNKLSTDATLRWLSKDLKQQTKHFNPTTIWVVYTIHCNALI